MFFNMQLGMQQGSSLMALPHKRGSIQESSCQYCGFQLQYNATHFSVNCRVLSSKPDEMHYLENVRQDTNMRQRVIGYFENTNGFATRRT